MTGGGTESVEMNDMLDPTHKHTVIGQDEKKEIAILWTDTDSSFLGGKY